MHWRRREEVIGKDVIDADAKKIGVTKDLAWTNEGKLGLVIELEDKEEESYLSFSEIEKIGDVVFVKVKSTFEVAPTIICTICKHKNFVEAKYCAKCGRDLGAKAEDKDEK